MATWDEIKKLAADLKRVQLTVSDDSQLTVDHVVKFIQILHERKKLSIVLSADRQKYITSEHLTQQIKDEVYIAGGKISITELVRILNIEFTAMECACHRLTQADDNYRICNDLLVHKQFYDRVIVDINKKLSDSGAIRLTNVINQYDLPTECIVPVIERAIGSEIKACYDAYDNNFLYTEDFVQTEKALLRAVLTAILTPTSVSKILTMTGLKESLFLWLFDELTQNGLRFGLLSNRYFLDKAVYKPHIYSKKVQNYIKDNFNANSYLDLEQLKKLGTINRDDIIASLPSMIVHWLDSALISEALFEELALEVRVQLQTNDFVDIVNCLPNTISTMRNAELFIEKLRLTSTDMDIIWPNKSGAIVYSPELVLKLVASLDTFINKEARKNAEIVISEYSVRDLQEVLEQPKLAKRNQQMKNLQQLAVIASENLIVKRLKNLHPRCPVSVLEDASNKVFTEAQHKYLICLKQEMDRFSQKALHQKNAQQRQLSDKFKQLYSEIRSLAIGVYFIGLEDKIVGEQLRLHLINNEYKALLDFMLNCISNRSVDAPLSVEERKSLLDQMATESIRGQLNRFYKAENLSDELLNEVLFIGYNKNFDLPWSDFEPNTFRKLNNQCASLLNSLTLLREKPIKSVNEMAQCLLVATIYSVAIVYCQQITCTGKLVPMLIKSLFTHDKCLPQLSEHLTASLKAISIAMKCENMQQAQDTITSLLDYLISEDWNTLLPPKDQQMKMLNRWNQVISDKQAVDLDHIVSSD